MDKYRIVTNGHKFRIQVWIPPRWWMKGRWAELGETKFTGRDSYVLPTDYQTFEEARRQLNSFEKYEAQLHEWREIGDPSSSEKSVNRVEPTMPWGHSDPTQKPIFPANGTQAESAPPTTSSTSKSLSEDYSPEWRAGFDRFIRDGEYLFSVTSPEIKTWIKDAYIAGRYDEWTKNQNIKEAKL